MCGSISKPHLNNICGLSDPGFLVKLPVCVSARTNNNSNSLVSELAVNIIYLENGSAQKSDSLTCEIFDAPGQQRKNLKTFPSVRSKMQSVSQFVTDAIDSCYARNYFKQSKE